MYVQPVPLVSIEWTGSPRRSSMDVIELDLREPRFLSKQELLQYDVEPDLAADEYGTWIAEQGEIDEDGASMFFDAVGAVLTNHCLKNSVDHVAVRFDRGDAILSLSSLALIGRGVGAGSDDGCVVISCATNACVAVVATNFGAFCGRTNLLVDFRWSDPIIGELQRHFDCVDGVAALPDGRIAVRGYLSDELYVIDSEHFVASEIRDPETRQTAQELLGGLPKRTEAFEPYNIRSSTQ